MSRPLKNVLPAAVMGCCTALLLSLGMALPLLTALFPQQFPGPAILLCLVFSLGFYGLFSVPLRFKWILPLAAALLLGIWCAAGGGPVYTAFQAIKAGFLSFQGIPEAALPYADTARWAICLMLCLLGASLAWDRTLGLAVTVVTAVVGLSFVFSGGIQLLWYALPAAAGLLLLLAREEGRRLAALLVAAVLTLSAFFALPAPVPTARPLEQLAQDIRDYANDYLFFNEYRTSFSLADEGYQPLQDRLGGPAEPRNHQVMEVGTDRTVLLRGRTFNEYTGLNWQDSLNSRQYLYSASRTQSLRDELFDLTRPLSGVSVAPQTVTVHMLSASPTTLFAPARTRTLNLESRRMVLYYNQAAELFLTRDLAPGDAYSLTYLPYAPGNAQTEAAVSASAVLSDPRYDQAARDYLTVPQHMYAQKELQTIVAEATAGARTPYEQALGIQNYLRTHYAYSLDVSQPPEGVDFVAWFLIGERQGYCTYFATAMTMLCRIAGLPARYVTGYLAVPDDSGVAVVTGRDAHAWTEVYLNGFGWLDFDATPRTDNDRSTDGDAPPPDAPPDENEPDAAPSPSPSPAPTPSPDPSPQPSPEPSPQPSPEPGEEPVDAPTPTPPPGAADAPTPTPDPAIPPDAPPENAPRPPFPWWILLLLATVGLITARFLLSLPLRRARRHPDRAAEILFDASARLLACRGVARQPQETLHAYAARADQALANDALPSIMPLADAYAAQLYGRHPAPVQPFRDAYAALHRAASPWARFRLALRRMMRFRGT